MLQLYVEQEFLNCIYLHPTMSRQGGTHLRQESWSVCALLGEQRGWEMSQAGAGLCVAAPALTTSFWAN